MNRDNVVDFTKPKGKPKRRRKPAADPLKVLAQSMHDKIGDSLKGLDGPVAMAVLMRIPRKDFLTAARRAYDYWAYMRDLFRDPDDAA